MAKLVEALKAYIDSAAVTPEQRDVCYREPPFVVRACPGSGKTKTTATRFAWRTANWRSRHSGIAVLSFTNIAWKEIGQQLQVLGLPPRPLWPHFLGTIDAFVNRHIFLPLGHSILGCKCRPEIVDGDTRPWVADHIRDRKFSACYQQGCSPLCFEFALQGQLRYTGPRQQPKQCGRSRCADLKATMVRRGLALYSDAMYWGLKVLANRDICRAIASRFPEIIVDEAQDTSEVQFKIIEALADAGAKIVLVGDPDQAIYEFHDARPDLFTGFATRLPVLPLSLNFRSSQLICNATWMFSSLASPPTAVGPDRACSEKPILRMYSPGEEASLLSWFEEKLAERNIEAARAVALARRHDLVAKLRGINTQDWPRGVTALSKALARASVYRDAGLLTEAHDGTMWAALRLCFDRHSYGARREAIESIGDRNWRRHTWQLLRDIPLSSMSLAEWGPTLRRIVDGFLEETGWPCQCDLGRTFSRSNNPVAKEPIAAFVRLPSSDLGTTCKVIHQVKGESYDAVMVVCAPNRRRKPGDLEQWFSPDTHGAAERRTGYVALTRARKLLVLAIPTGAQLTDAQSAALAKAFDYVR